LKLVVGNQADRYASLAASDGFQVLSIEQASKEANLIFMLLPDEVMPHIYLENVAPHLRTNDMLIFASGYSVAYGFIEPPSYVDAGLIAPRHLGVAVRDGFVSGLGYPCYVAVAQDYTGQAWNRLLAAALAVGALRQGAIEVSFNQEVELDLFMQQAVLPAIHHTLLAAAEVLINEGYSPEVALTELYLSGELGAILARAAIAGWSRALRRMSPTAQYGILSRTLDFQEMKMRRQMETILDDIRNGDFAQEWSSEFRDGYPRMQQMRRRFESSPMWRYEKEVLEILRGLEISADDDF
ncbi:MAG: ketol-acid reductoisomerase, partial [Phototrophicales bacterium]